MTPKDLPTGWNDTATDYERHATIDQVFRARCNECPDDIAVIDGDTWATYRQLSDRAASVANRLSAHLSGNDQRIGVLAHRSIDTIAAFLGILRAGAAFVPLDPKFPAERLRFMTEDTGARAILVAENATGSAPRVDGVPCLSLEEMVADDEQFKTDREFGPRSLAYVMYTSGSSGRPKGVAIEHRGVLRYVRGAHGFIPERSDRVLHAAELGFDVATYEIWGALCNGSLLVVHPNERFDPVEVGATVRRHGVNVGMFATGALHQMIDRSLESLGGYRMVLAGGDVLSPTHARRLRDAHPATKLVNTYGPTEATVTASVYEVGDLRPGQPIPIGRPLANTGLYVLDAELRPAAFGESGELFIGGDGVARGYLNRPEATAQAFLAGPSSPVPGERLYRTGDLVRLMENGDLEFLGRLDDQVKISGYRVEPEEVAATLRGHPAVETAIVVVREEISGHKRLVAYVAATYDVSAHRLRRYLRSRLPEYMVPSSFVVLDHMPLTTNGKIDRATLPAPVRSIGRSAPSGETEELLASIWCEVLQLGEAMADDDFFDAGGDSLLALLMLSRIRDEFKIELRLDTVFTERTLEAIAQSITKAQRQTDDKGADEVALSPLVARLHGPGERASITQSQAAFLSELADESLPYQSQALIHLEGQLDEDVLRRVLQTIVDRHEVLRTGFPKVDGTWLQAISDKVEADLSVVDLRDATDPEAAFALVLAERVAARIDIAEPPLIHWTLVRQPGDRAVLIQVEHHLIHDGWSFARMMGELVAVYSAYAKGEANPLPALQLQYADFASWQRDFIDSPAGRAQLEYWLRNLADASPPPDLPFDRPIPATRDYRGMSLRSELGPELADALRRAADVSGCTPFMVMLAAYFIFLSRLSGETDLVVGSGLSNRRLPGIEPLIGMFVNTVALRLDLSDDPTVTDVLERVREVALGAFAHQELPFEEVVRALAPKRRAGRGPLYAQLFSFHDSLFSDLELEDLDVRAHDTLSNGSSKADLNVIVINRRGRRTSEDLPDGEDMSLVWEFATDVCDEPTGRHLMELYLGVLHQVVRTPDQSVSSLAIITGAEEAQLMSDLAANVRGYEHGSTIDQVFAARVRESPTAVAVTVGPEQLTYSELDIASDAVADHLLARGIGAEARVGVIDDRSLSAVVALVGILKAGSAYVGIDRTAPPARLQLVLESAGVQLICTGPEGAGDLAGLDVEFLPVEAAARAGDEHGSGDREHGALSAAYVSFTSGSTGVPKGVEVSHRNVLRLVRGSNYVDLGPTDVVLASAPLSFDASTFEIWSALLNGGRLVLAPAGVLSTAELATVLVDCNVTTAWFTASIFHRMVDHQLDSLRGLRQVLAGGDVLSVAHVSRLLSVLPPEAVLINGYGPTEGTTFTCCHRMQGGTRIEGPVPIGRPIANSWALAMDTAGRPVPEGVIGELWIGGDGVALGYVGDPDSASFVVNPFPSLFGRSVYRSGDRVRRRRDGAFEFLGRIDRQVKIRGHRVEPAETESALRAHPMIAQCHVMPTELGPDDTRLVGYVTPAEPPADAAALHPGTTPPTLPDKPVSDAELVAFLARVLPRYMIPTAFVWLPWLPMTSAGKIATDRLPGIASAWFVADAQAGEVTPGSTLARPMRGASRMEAVLIGIWQEVTGVRDVGLDDDFFELGGHSLLAVELFAAIERTTGARLPLSAIFEAPTVAQMAAVLRSDGWDARSGSLVALATSGSRPPIFAVTAGDGNVVGYGPLSRRLGPDQPFYVLQPFGLDSAAPLHRTISAMARHYVRQIRRVQRHGPYLLVGRCYGSLVAYEMARRLEAVGETVAMLASIDSIGPFWRPRRMANGVTYDPMMNLARVNAIEAGLDTGDVFSERSAADQFLKWLDEPVAEHDGVEVSRYIHTAYLSHPDLYATFSLGEDGDGRADHLAVVRWAQLNGTSQLEMQASFLPPLPPGPRPIPLADVRLRTRRRHAADRALDWLHFVSRGRRDSLAARRRDEVLRIAYENVVRYRAGPLTATVALILSEDEAVGLQKAQLARWYGLEVGAIEEHFVAGSHHSMLREPAVRSLAACLERCATAGLEAVRTNAGRVE